MIDSQPQSDTRDAAPAWFAITPARVLVLLIAVNAVIALGIFALRAPTSARALPAAPVALPAQVEELRLRAQAGHTGERYALELTDAELSATMEYFLAQSAEIPFARPRVSVLPHRITVEAVTRGTAVAVPVRVIGALSTAQGLPVAELQDVSLGDVPLPAPVREQIIREANQSLDFRRYPMPISVDGIQLQTGRVMINGVLK